MNPRILLYIALVLAVVDYIPRAEPPQRLPTVTSVQVSTVTRQATAEQKPIPLIICPISKGYQAGTAFRISAHLLLSAKHVTSAPHCKIDGQPISLTYTSAKQDFSMLTDNRPGDWLRVDCNGFVPGKRYIAIGHARATDDLTRVELIATSLRNGGFVVLAGIFEAQPGQSGGPIVDAESGAVVGTVNAANWEDGTTFSVELKGTPVCGGSLA